MARPPLLLLPALRWLVLTAVVALSLAALAGAAMALLPDSAVESFRQALGPVVGNRPWLAQARPWLLDHLGLAGTLVLLLGVLMGGAATLSGLRLVEGYLGDARRDRYRAQARERHEAREQAQRAAPAERVERVLVQAILLVDLVQSTELIAAHGDVFFRNLLRRMETEFIPVARKWNTRSVDGHGDGLLFCFEDAVAAHEALRAMFSRLAAINRDMPPGVEAAFRASLHVGETFADTRGNRTGLAVLKTVRLGSVMEQLHGRGAGRNSLVVSAEVLPALLAAGVPAKLLGQVELRGFPGTHAVYQVEV